MLRENVSSVAGSFWLLEQLLKLRKTPAEEEKRVNNSNIPNAHCKHSRHHITHTVYEPSIAMKKYFLGLTVSKRRSMYWKMRNMLSLSENCIVESSEFVQLWIMPFISK